MMSQARWNPLLIALIFLGSGCGGASETGAGVETASAPPPAATEEPGQGEAPVETTGTLDILSDPPQDVVLDGKPIGKTPLTNYRVDAGSHDVTFLDPVEGDRTMSVSVNPGDHQTVKLDHAPKIRETR